MDINPIDPNNLPKKHGLLISQTAEEYMKNAMAMPASKMLFDELWYMNEVCILFSDTNLGKSCLAVQIANSITHGIPIDNLRLQVEPQPVIYFDFELSERQFLMRYSNYDDISFTAQNVHIFSKNFIRSTINHNAPSPSQFSFEDKLMESIEAIIKTHDSKILIIDNLTYLKSEIDKAKNALPLMQKINSLKRQHDLSILVLAHTPKRDLSKLITQNDLAGSKMLLNFCDSAFAIGQSQIDKKLRYIKQIKQRNTGIKYDAENVLVFELDKLDNFLMFKFVRLSSEQEHLKVWSEYDKTRFKIQVMELHRKGLTQREIATQLGTYPMKVKRIIDLHQEGG